MKGLIIPIFRLKKKKYSDIKNTTAQPRGAIHMWIHPGCVLVCKPGWQPQRKEAQ